jgi:hypothetical protein
LYGFSSLFTAAWSLKFRRLYLKEGFDMVWEMRLGNIARHGYKILSGKCQLMYDQLHSMPAFVLEKDDRQMRVKGLQRWVVVGVLAFGSTLCHARENVEATDVSIKSDLVRKLEAKFQSKLKQTGDKSLPKQHYLEEWGYAVDCVGNIPYFYHGNKRGKKPKNFKVQSPMNKPN